MQTITIDNIINKQQRRFVVQTKQATKMTNANENIINNNTALFGGARADREGTLDQGHPEATCLEQICSFLCLNAILFRMFTFFCPFLLIVVVCFYCVLNNYDMFIY